jgi:hypothetical protein
MAASAFESDSSFETDATVIERNKSDLADARMALHVEAKLTTSETLSPVAI